MADQSLAGKGWAVSTIAIWLISENNRRMSQIRVYGCDVCGKQAGQNMQGWFELSYCWSKEASIFGQFAHFCSVECVKFADLVAKQKAEAELVAKQKMEAK